MQRFTKIRDSASSRVWWCTPVIPIVRDRGQKVNTLRPAWATRDPLSSAPTHFKRNEKIGGI